MKNPLRFLKDNWLKYGFETVAIVVGILGAFALSTWQESSKEKNSEQVYLANLLVDLEGHLDNIEYQILFEKDSRESAEEVIRIIEKSPYNLAQLNLNLISLGRRSFVLNSPVFEDLKYSGHLSIISETGFRQSIFKFYQYVEYVETVIASNNSNYVDKMSYQLLNMAVADQGYKKDLTMGKMELEFSLDVEPFTGAEELIISQLENNEVRFRLHNLMVIRGRLSSLQISLLETLKAENQHLIKQLKIILDL